MASGSFLTLILTQVLPAVLLALFKGFNDRQTQSQARADQVDLGQSRAAAATNKETADAERRASERMQNTGDLDDLLAGMAEGKF
jgi:hypothetical protein